MINSTSVVLQALNFPILIDMLYDFLQLNCPECGERIDKTSLTCSKGHSYALKEGVLTLFPKEFEKNFRTYLDALNTYNKEWSTVVRDPKQFEQLPNASVPGQEKDVEPTAP